MSPQASQCDYGCIKEHVSFILAWLDDQPTGSVFYVSFGSRTAMSREQIRELGEGLVRTGFRFLWVVKDKKVDMEDDEKLTEVLGQGLLERVKEKGLAVKTWLNQEEVLRHPAIGGFLSHFGWNSLSEALWNGVRILAWPQHGDQKINADLVQRIGLGVWVKSRGWGEEEMVVEAEDIAERVKEIMGNDTLRLQALHIKEGVLVVLQRDSLLSLRHGKSFKLVKPSFSEPIFIYRWTPVLRSE